MAGRGDAVGGGEPAQPAGARAVPVPGDGFEGVEVWVAEVAEASGAASDLETLSPDERERAGRFRRLDDRLEYVVAHRLLRQLLGRRVGRAPGELAFRRAPCPVCRGPHGRPELVEADGGPPSLQFSLSHAAGLVLVALADRPVGVDVEAYPEPDTVAAVSPTLPPRERQAIGAAAAAERPAVFARAWARLEAHLKAIGTGIAVDLGGIDLGAAEAAGWRIADVAAGPEVAAAVALAPPQIAAAGD